MFSSIVYWSILICVGFIDIVAESITSQQCTERFMELGLLTFRAGRIGLDRVGNDLDNTIRILTEYQFNCSSTTITSVIVGGDLRAPNNNRQFFPSVQIWRPQESNPEQYYLVVDSERTIYYSTNNVSTNGVFEYPLDPPISVQSGDILAISQPSQGNSFFRVYYIEGVVNFDSHQINFGSTTADLSGNSISNDLVLVYPITDGACVSSSINATVIKENALLIHNARQPGDKRQYIYPEMKFSCNGSVIKWIYGAVDQNRATGDLPELQIWRQTGPTSYNKEGSSLATVNSTDNSNVHVFYPVAPLDFQEGDIFGIHIPEDKDNKLLLYEQRESGPLNLRIDSDVDSPAPTTINSALRTEGANDFPLVTLEISIDTPTVTLLFSSFLSTSTAVVTTIVSTSVNGNDFMSTNALSTSPPVTLISTLSQSISISPAISVPPVINTTPRLDPSGNNEAHLVGAIVAVLVLLITVIICIVIIIAIVLVRKRKMVDKCEVSKLDNGHTLNNPLYGDNQQKIVPLLSPNNIEYNVLSTTHYETEYSFYTEAGMPKPTNDLSPHYLEPTPPAAAYNHLEWGIIVPTMAQRNKLSDYINQSSLVGDDIYSTLTQSGENYQVVDGDHNSVFFTEAEIYWTPGSDCTSIYEQLAQQRYREIIRGQISIEGHLGSGQFGTVAQGVWISPDGPLGVAIKTLKDDASEEEKVKFLQEAAIMGQFHHPNIVKLYGVVTMAEPVMIVLELMKHGDMKQYLETFIPSPGELVPSTLPTLLLSFCRQIASGMEYLSKKCFVHRDLAARNILVTEDHTCKISDFGLSRDLQDENYYISKGGQVPVKWTAPEALLYKKYSSASDVWSFGVLMFEIWSLGHKPFSGITNQQTFRKIGDGYRLPPPPGCPRSIYEMMIQCWHPETSSRPTFANLVSRLSQPEWGVILWTRRDKETHPQAAILGAPLEAGQGLYLELQNAYYSYKGTL